MDQMKEYNLWLELNDLIEKKQQQQNLNKLELMYQNASNFLLKKIPQGYSNTFNEFFSTAFFHTQSLIQTTKQFQEKKLDILNRAQILRSDIKIISDLRKLPLRQLNFLAEQEISKALIISSVQGGISGTSSKLALFGDLPALIFINLKTVQEIALCYGYDVSIPKEMECSLKVLQGAILPSTEKYVVWSNLMKDILKHDDSDVFATWENEFKEEGVYYTVILQMCKLLMIHLLRKKVLGGIPLLGVTVGAKWNESFTKNVLEYTKKFYQYRILSERVNQEPKD
ncbi:EcsC family protein [Gottfriedia acidiceleris]|uniref:EcsC family protein n=1 Tax=Gottfriedia acidiceleris TaxID=371036 RepID=UPI00101C3226|nr:EcsC family protein [Gottfriedia acidiceleris]